MTPLNKDTIDNILELTGGDESILVELFQSFLLDAKELSERIKKSAVSSDVDQLVFDVHTLKGLCGTIGAIPLYEVCKVLNDDLKSGNMSTSVDLANETILKYEDLMGYITSNYKV